LARLRLSFFLLLKIFAGGGISFRTSARRDFFPLSFFR